MSADSVTPTATPATHDEAKLSHIAKAVGMTIDTCEPGECSCGNRLPYHGARECGACWALTVENNLHRQRERRAMLKQQADAGDVDAQDALRYLKEHDDAGP